MYLATLTQDYENMKKLLNKWHFESPKKKMQNESIQHKLRWVSVRKYLQYFEKILNQPPKEILRREKSIFCKIFEEKFAEILEDLSGKSDEM